VVEEVEEVEAEEIEEVEYPEESELEKAEEEEGEDVMTRSDMVRLARELLTDRTLPQEIKEKFWALSDPEIAVTFLDEKDRAVFENLFEDCVMSFITSLPRDKYTFELDRDIAQLRFKFLIKLKRAIGMDRTRINERVALISQLRGEIPSRRPKIRRGILAKFFGVGGEE